MVHMTYSLHAHAHAHAHTHTHTHTHTSVYTSVCRLYLPGRVTCPHASKKGNVLLP